MIPSFTADLPLNQRVKGFYQEIQNNSYQSQITLSNVATTIKCLNACGDALSECMGFGFGWETCKSYYEMCKNDCLSH